MVYSARGSNNQLAPRWRGRTNTVSKKGGQALSTSGCTIRAESHVDGDRHTREPDWHKESARAIKLEPDESPWDVERLECEVAAMRPQATREFCWRQEFHCRQSLEQEDVEANEEFLARDVCTSERSLRSRNSDKLRDVKVVLQSPKRILDQHLTLTSAMLDPNALKNPKDGKVTWRQEPDVVVGRRRSSSSSSSGAAAASDEVHAPRGTRRTGEYAGLPSLQDLAESRLVQSAHGETMRSGELSYDTSEVAEVFWPRRLAASWCLFHMFLEIVLELRTGWNPNDPAGKAKCWATLEERGSLPQLSESTVKRLKPGDMQRLETEALTHLTFCVSVHRWQSEKK